MAAVWAGEATVVATVFVAATLAQEAVARDDEAAGMATAFAIRYGVLVAVVVLQNSGRAGTCHMSDLASLRLQE